MPGILTDPTIALGTGALNTPDQSSPGYVLDPNDGRYRYGSGGVDDVPGLPSPALNIAPDAPQTLAVQQASLPDPAVPANTPWYKKPGVADALLAFGSGMLSGRSFTDGLGKGSAALGQAFDNYRISHAPVTSYLANGAVIATRDPYTGKVTYQYNPTVQKAVQDQNTIKIAGQMVAQGAKDAANMDRTKYRAGATFAASEDRTDALRDIAAGHDDTSARNTDARSNAGIEVANIGADSRRDVARINRQNKFLGRQAPASAVKDYNNLASDNAQTALAVSQLDKVDSWLADGSLELGVGENWAHEAQLATGINPTEGSTKYGLMKQTLEQLRNGKLRLNKGVQTEGDAQRAANEILAGKGDATAVRANLAVIRNALSQSYSLNNRARDTYRQQYGIDNAGASPNVLATQARPVRSTPTSGTTPGGIVWHLKAN